MKQEYSYGIIPLRFYERQWQVLLVQHHAGHWAFPKGHAEEEEETPRQTAERELQEETGLTLQHYLSSDALTENYLFIFQGQHISKTVQYFLALVTGQVVIQKNEIQASCWLALSNAYIHITFKEAKYVCLQVIEFLKSVDEKGHPLWA